MVERRAAQRVEKVSDVRDGAEHRGAQRLELERRDALRCEHHHNDHTTTTMVFICSCVYYLKSPWSAGGAAPQVVILLGEVPRTLGGTRRALGVLVARHSKHDLCWVDSRELPPEQSYGALNRNVRSQSSPGADQELKGRRPGRNKQVFFWVSYP